MQGTKWFNLFPVFWALHGINQSVTSITFKNKLPLVSIAILFLKARRFFPSLTDRYYMWSLSSGPSAPSVTPVTPILSNYFIDQSADLAREQLECYSREKPPVAVIWALTAAVYLFIKYISHKFSPFLYSVSSTVAAPSGKE